VRATEQKKEGLVKQNDVAHLGRERRNNFDCLILWIKIKIGENRREGLKRNKS
jgi:hypothetical protein